MRSASRRTKSVVQPLHPRRTHTLGVSRARDRHALAAVMPDQRPGLDSRETKEREEIAVDAVHIRKLELKRHAAPSTTTSASIAGEGSCRNEDGSAW